MSMTIRDPLMPETPQELRDAELARLRSLDSVSTVVKQMKEIGRLRAEVASLKKERDAIYRAAMTAGVSAMVIQDEVSAALKDGRMG